MAYTNSSLVSYTKLSPNHSGQRTHSIDRITPHCVVGQCSVETLGNIFLPTSRQASCNYGIGVDGRVGMYVEEKNRSWCSSSSANDQRAITIECASDTTEPYAFIVIFRAGKDLPAQLQRPPDELLWITVHLCDFFFAHGRCISLIRRIPSSAASQQKKRGKYGST